MIIYYTITISQQKSDNSLCQKSISTNLVTSEVKLKHLFKRQGANAFNSGFTWEMQISEDSSSLCKGSTKSSVKWVKKLNICDICDLWPPNSDPKTELDTHDIPRSLFSAWDSCSLCSWHVQIGDILTPAIPSCRNSTFLLAAKVTLFINFQGFATTKNRRKRPGTWRAESSFGWT